MPMRLSINVLLNHIISNMDFNLMLIELLFDVLVVLLMIHSCTSYRFIFYHNVHLNIIFSKQEIQLQKINLKYKLYIYHKC
jgi:hypothetical protein